MPRHQYIGKQTEKSENYFQTNVTFEDLVNNKKMNNIRKPNYQGSLLEDKVEEMIVEYLKKPILLKLKNRIIIGVWNNNWYILDGQHRIEMGKTLYINHKKEDSLVFCWYICENENMLREIFISVNKDSSKNEYYVNQKDIFGNTKEEFTGKLKKYHNADFAKKKSQNGRFKTIEEFVIELDNMKYFESFENAQEAYDNLRYKNSEFFEINRYEVIMINNGSNFYEPEKKLIRQKIIFTMRGNNFVEWLGDETKAPYHKTKISKSSISNYKKGVVWKKEFGDEVCGVCPISFCDNILRKGKGIKNGYQCGHIISEFHGGATEPNNMRPICGGCNQSMGSKNWYVYDPIQY